jgi:hypothetical protein
MALKLTDGAIESISAHADNQACADVADPSVIVQKRAAGG